MKFFFFAAACFLFFSCNSHDEQHRGNEGSSAAVSEEQALQDAVKQYPDSALLFENLLQYYTEAGNYDKAISALNSVLAKDSMNPRLWDIRSDIFVQKGDTVNAMRSLETAVAIYPVPQYIISLGALYAETKNPKALEMADGLLAADKARAEKEAYFIKGLYYSFAGEKEKALPFFDKCIALNYTFMEAYLEKGIALYDLKKYAESAAVLEKAVKLQNNFDRGYYFLGRTYEKLNRKDDAADAYNTALMYDPGYAEAKDALAKLAQ